MSEAEAVAADALLAAQRLFLLAAQQLTAHDRSYHYQTTPGLVAALRRAADGACPAQVLRDFLASRGG